MTGSKSVGGQIGGVLEWSLKSGLIVQCLHNQSSPSHGAATTWNIRDAWWLPTKQRVVGLHDPTMPAQWNPLTGAQNKRSHFGSDPLPSDVRPCSVLKAALSGFSTTMKASCGLRYDTSYGRLWWFYCRSYERAVAWKRWIDRWRKTTKAQPIGWLQFEREERWL